MTEQKAILYFEDDHDLSSLFIEYLSQQGYAVTHYPSFPEGGIAEIKEHMAKKPDFVLLDMSLPGTDGIDICHILRKSYGQDNIPILFVSGQMSEQDIIRAYDAGADDYLIKPVRLKELKIKLEKLAAQIKESEVQQQQMSGAQKMAFEAMTTSSELGEILRFHEECYRVENLDALMNSLLQAITKFSLKSSILVFGESPSFYRDDGQSKPLEEKTLLAFKDQKRIYAWKNRTFFNYKYFSVLIRDMPINDEVRHGILNDQLCLLLNGIDANIHSLMIEERNKKNAATMTIAADTLANMVMEIENENVKLSQKFESIILSMEANISSDIVSFNLLEEEEKTLLNHIVTAIKESTEIFETSMRKEKQYKDIMSQLLKDLVSSK
ncbi:MAG: response regulator [Kangiellaceae bacterium]|nr:response regulator [Kangiellaceae bacterium]